MDEVYILDHDTPISEPYSSVEEVIEEMDERGSYHVFVDLLVNGEKITIFQGIDY